MAAVVVAVDLSPVDVEQYDVGVRQGAPAGRLPFGVDHVDTACGQIGAEPVDILTGLDTAGDGLAHGNPSLRAGIVGIVVGDQPGTQRKRIAAGRLAVRPHRQVVAAGRPRNEIKPGIEPLSAIVVPVEFEAVGVENKEIRVGQAAATGPLAFNVNRVLDAGLQFGREPVDIVTGFDSPVRHAAGVDDAPCRRVVGIVVENAGAGHGYGVGAGRVSKGTNTEVVGPAGRHGARKPGVQALAAVIVAVDLTPTGVVQHGKRVRERTAPRRLTFDVDDIVGAGLELDCEPVLVAAVFDGAGSRSANGHPAARALVRSIIVEPAGGACHAERIAARA